MKIRLFAGGYTEPILQGTGEIVEGRCKGISTYAFDTDTGRLQAVLAPCPTPNPSYIIVSPDGRVLGKMGHAERIGAGLYRNVPGQYDMKLFGSAVKCFK